MEYCRITGKYSCLLLNKITVNLIYPNVRLRKKKPMVNLIIADDHQKFRSSLAEYLESIPGFRVIGEASNGKQLIETIEAKKDLSPFVIMDVHMPEMDGVTTTSYLAQHNAGVKIIGMSVSNDFNHVIRMIKAGAKGFIWKSSLSDYITEAIQKIAADQVYTDPCFANELEAYVKENGSPTQWNKPADAEQQVHAIIPEKHPGLFSKLKSLFH